MDPGENIAVDMDEHTDTRPRDHDLASTPIVIEHAMREVTQNQSASKHDALHTLREVRGCTVWSRGKETW